MAWQKRPSKNQSNHNRNHPVNPHNKLCLKLSCLLLILSLNLRLSLAIFFFNLWLLLFYSVFSYLPFTAFDLCWALINDKGLGPSRQKTQQKIQRNAPKCRKLRPRCEAIGPHQREMAFRWERNATRTFRLICFLNLLNRNFAAFHASA